VPAASLDPAGLRAEEPDHAAEQAAAGGESKHRDADHPAGAAAAKKPQRRPSEPGRKEQP